MNDHAKKMDGLYRFQRHIYDASRKFFLPGRTLLVSKMVIGPNEHVLEIGCGTCSNIIWLAQKHCDSYFYGIDASRKMLETAASKIESYGLSGRIQTEHGLAEQMDLQKIFGRMKPYDVIFYSYSLSMISDWKTSLLSAYGNLASSGRLYIVDFWDHANLPFLIGSFFKKWLGVFHVRHDPDMIPFLHRLASDNGHQFSLEPVWGRYAFNISIEKTSVPF